MKMSCLFFGSRLHTCPVCLRIPLFSSQYCFNAEQINVNVFLLKVHASNEQTASVTPLKYDSVPNWSGLLLLQTQGEVSTQLANSTRANRVMMMIINAVTRLFNRLCFIYKYIHTFCFWWIKGQYFQCSIFLRYYELSLHDIGNPVQKTQDKSYDVMMLMEI